tara:strand:- start:17822 stop:19207 length:1386 start_codon:yes stop_codon:yes gene_type:complete
MVNIFIHRRDLRFDDNTTMIKMHKELKDNVIPIFIFNPVQIYPDKNPYFSHNLVNYLCKSLKELDSEYKDRDTKLNLFEGDIINILESIHKKETITNLGFNKDYSPFSKKRDKEIIEWCKKNNITIFCEEDMLLIDIESKKGLNPNSDKPYVVFTPFMNNLRKYPVEKIKKHKLKYNSKTKLSNKYSISINEIDKYYVDNKDLNVIPGRKEGLKIIKKIGHFDNYDKCRNYLTYSTTHLSAYINLGSVSIREIYHQALKKLGNKSGLITELYWRDFYYNILNYFPDNIGNSFRKEYDKIKWSNNISLLNKWKKGETGFPVVDACMRQMNTTGYMHNRGRMIVASFLTKDLFIDWRKGEKYFATQLIDYNMSANNGGWQWAAGTGTDAQPYFRIFNPWTQSEKFDPECKYIKKWIPELEDIPPKDIHTWNICHNKHKGVYIKPIIDHKTARLDTLKKYKQYL